MYIWIQNSLVVSHKIQEAGVAQGKSHAGWEHNTKFISLSDEPDGMK